MKSTKIIFIVSIIVGFAVLVAIFLALIISVNNKQNTNKNNNINNNLQTNENNINNNQILTPEKVALHNKLSDCWMIVNGKVYDVTSYVNAHPGGSAEIAKACGKDGTQLYASKDKDPATNHSANAYSLLEQYYVGDLNKEIVNAQNPTTTNQGVPEFTTPPSVNVTAPTTTPTTVPRYDVTLNLAEVSKHDSTSDCWLLISGKIYDVTPYIRAHPGGVTSISAGCGTDATQLYATKGGNTPHSSFATSLLADYYIGNLNQQISNADLTNRTTAINNTIPPTGGDDEYEDEDEFEDD